MNSARISAKGQITLPADVRRSLGVKAGDRVDFVRNPSGHIELQPRKAKLSDLRGLLKQYTDTEIDELDDWIGEARAAMSGGADDRD